MTTVKDPGGVQILPGYHIGGNAPIQWKLKTQQLHILPSKCSEDEIACAINPCLFCLFRKTLQISYLPDMVFPKNILRLEHESGAVIEFNALDALKRVANHEINIEFPLAKEWKASRTDGKKLLKEKETPFDWTFTTDYMGTVSGFEIEETEEQIDFHHLAKQKIGYYQRFILYVDEVHDRGHAELSVKIRVMEDCLYILLRYYLRVDDVMLRINDTRLYHHYSKPYLLRQYTSRESEIQGLEIPLSILLEPSLISLQMPLKHIYYHKLIFSTKSGNNEENSKHMGKPSKSLNELLKRWSDLYQ